MSVTFVMNHLYQITVPTPFKVGPVNCYLATTDPITLIDTGPLHADTRVELEAGFKEIGLARKDIRRIIITHAHSDHYGLAAEIVRDSKAEVWTHRYNRSTLDAQAEDRQRRSEFYWQIMIEAGVPGEERQRLADSRRGGERYAESVKIDRNRAWRSDSGHRQAGQAAPRVSFAPRRKDSRSIRRGRHYSNFVG